MNVTVSREQGYWRAKCDDKGTCASFTSAGNVGAYWRGPHRSKQRDAHLDAIAHLAGRHGVRTVCENFTCSAPAAGVVQRQGVTLLRCTKHHVDLHNDRRP